MKTLITILVAMTLTVSFTLSAGSQDHSMMGGQNKHKMRIMDDYDARSMMMDQIVDDPEMRQEMIHKIMQSMDMQEMMNDPDMKARMQTHVSMMQAMLDSDGMDPAKMKGVMGNPEMTSMMKMHMMCAEATDGEMMGNNSKESGEDNAH
jgi:hypothetical protein